MKNLYLLACFKPNVDFSTIQYFDDFEYAKEFLASKKMFLKSAVGLNVLRDNDSEFSFALGNDHHIISWKIIERQFCSKE